VRKGGQYIEPIDRHIVIQSLPAGLFIRIRNTSDAAVSVRINPEMAYSIELKDEDGRTSVIKRKNRAGSDAGDDTRVRLASDTGAEGLLAVSTELSQPNAGRYFSHFAIRCTPAPPTGGNV
jgi:hypothetical protein